MKKPIFLFALIITAIFSSLMVNYFINITPKTINEIKNPQPKKIDFLSDDDEANEWKERLEWIEQMHKCDTNINWRTINYEVRKEKSKLRKSYSNSKNGSIEIAAGLLTGEWRETGSNNLAGRTHYTEYDAVTDSIYCASSGGNIWKASKTGDGWQCLNDNFKIDDIKMIRKIENGIGYRLLVSSGGWGIPGFYYSDNDGQTWIASTGLSGISDWGNVIKTYVANDANKTIYLLSMEWNYTDWEKETCIYVSTNKGASFTKKASFLETTYGDESKFDIWCDPQGTTCYLAVNDEIYYLNSSFVPVLISQFTIQNPGSILLSGCETPTQTYLYVGVYTDNYVEFYQSSDAGANWTQKGNIAAGPFMKNSFTVSQKDPNRLYYGGVECYRSSNGGQNWTMLNTWGDYYADIANKLHADIPGINSYIDGSDNEFVYINTDGGTYISYNQLQTVENISMFNLNIGQFYSVYSHKTNNSFIFAGSQDQGYQICDNNQTLGTANFTQILSGDYGHIVSTNGGNSIWMVYPGFAAYYPNATGDQYNSSWWEFTCTGQFWIPPLMPHPTVPNICYLGGGTTTSGTHIFEIISNLGLVVTNELSYDFSGTTDATAISAMAFSTLDNNYRYVMNGNGEFFTSTDDGSTWILTSGFDGPDGNYLYGASIIPSKVQLGKVYVAGSGYSNPPVFASEDNGQTFTSISTGMPSTMVYEMAITPDDEMIFAATDAGPYVYITANNEWYDLAQNIAPDQIYWTVDYSPLSQIARFGTYGRGIWDFKITTNSSISNNFANQSINIFPNPAQDFISISKYNGNIKIFSIYGKLMIDQQNSTKIDVSSLSAGVYILKTTSSSNKFVKL